MNDPRDPIPPERVARYLARTIETPDGCLLWQGWINRSGYAEVTVLYRKTILHRLVYESRIGPIPEGADLHHRCGRRSCINPSHVEPIAHGGHAALHVDHLAAFNEERRAASVCGRGHDLLDETNVYVAADGRRRCRACRREAGRRHDRNRTPRRRRDHVRA